MILVLTHTNGFEPDLVIDQLRARGARFARLNFDQMLAKSSITIFQQHGVSDALMRIGKHRLRLAEVSVAWTHETPLYCFDAGIPASARAILQDETQAFVDGLCGMLSARWVNSPECIRRASNKILQHRVAQQVGLLVPATVVTNDPEQAREFCEAHSGDVIMKDLNYVPREVEGRFLGSWTKRLPDSLRSDYSAVQLTPVFLQEQIPKQHELRITIVGQCIFAGALDSQAHDISRTDWRKYNLDQPMKKWKVNLPEDVAQKCLALMKRLNLQFGAIDMIVTPSGGHCFLEINTTGAWGWLERDLGFPISSAFADLLTHPGPIEEPAIAQARG